MHHFVQAMDLTSSLVIVTASVNSADIEALDRAEQPRLFFFF